MSQRNYGLVTSIPELARHCERLMAGDVIGFDIETGYHGEDRKKHSVHPETSFIVGVSFTCSGDWALYAPLGHDCGGNLDNIAAARLLWPVLRTGKGVAHNAKFELRNLAKWFRECLYDDPEYGADVVATRGYFPILGDTQILAYLNAEHQFFGLKALTKAIFDHDQADLMSLFPGLAKNKKDFLRFNPLPLEEHVVSYACEDALWAWELYHYFKPKVDAARPLLDKVEHALVQDVVCGMEDFGVAYDWEFLARAKAEVEVFRDRFNAEIMADLAEMTDEPVAINLGSPPQIRKVLYEKLGYTTNVYTKSTRNKPRDERVMATDKIALAGLAKKHPIVRKIVEWKQLTKLLGTYLGKYEGLFNYAGDGRTHPNHLTAFVVTGRFAVSDPPYQQSPKVYHHDLKAGADAHARHADAHGKDCACDDPQYAPPAGSCFKFNFRDAIVAPPGYYLLGFDLSQAELRAIAGEAKEPELLRAFATGQDVHTVTTALMLKIPIADVTKKLRQIGKAQPLDAQVLTPTGFRRMGDLAVGDLVSGADGRPTRVTGIHPQGVKQVYRVMTSDGAVTECCEEHLWTVRNINTKSRIWATRSLRHLIDAGLRSTTAGRSKGKDYFQPKYVLPARPVVAFAPQVEPGIDPYVLGLLLGDGGFTHTWGPSFGSADEELLLAVRTDHEGRGGRWASESQTSPGFHVGYLASGQRYARNPTTAVLRDLGLWGKKGDVKFVPRQYLLGSPEVRLAVLQGLLDTDGTVQASGALFRVTSRQLALDVQFIARSLGGWASFKEQPAETTPYHVKNAPLPQWAVYLRLPAGLCPFRLSRKVAKWQAPAYIADQRLMDVVAVGEKPMQCISVEADNGLYITDGFTVTHNTLNFALLYGMGVKSLADRLGIEVEEAQGLYDSYFAVYSNIAAWSERQVAFGQQHGYVTSKFGRRLPIWEYKSENRWIQQKGDRACVNYPIQGAATGDYMKILMVRMHNMLKKDPRTAGKVQMVMNVHDALEFYVRDELNPGVVIEVLDKAFLPVNGWPQMQADWHFGRRWGSPVEIELRDGRLIAKDGDRDVDITATTYEEDDETGEAVEVMPEVDIDLLRRVAVPQRSTVDEQPDVHTALSKIDTGRNVIVTLPEAPDAGAYRRFLDYIRAHPGGNSLTVRVPEGEFQVDLTHGTALEPGHTARVAVILGPCTVTFEHRDVDAGHVIGTLTL